MNFGMYINLGVIVMFFSMLGVMITVGGIIWKLSEKIGGIQTEVKVLSANFASHIENCEVSAPLRKPRG